MRFVYDDGGRAAAGYRGRAGDCVTRAVAIASGKPYREVYAALAQIEGEYKRMGVARPVSARNGIHFSAKFKAQMRAWGFRWVSCMGIGTGCRVHLREGELPKGRLVARVSRHCCAVIDGAIHDTYDPSRAESRCVYGYWIWQATEEQGRG